MIRIRFTCGHDARLDPDKVPSPVCVECGCRTIARTISVSSPRFTGCVSGPLATTKALEPQAVPLATTPLTLKDPQETPHGR